MDIVNYKSVKRYIENFTPDNNNLIRWKGEFILNFDRVSSEHAALMARVDFTEDKRRKVNDNLKLIMKYHQAINVVMIKQIIQRHCI